MLEVDEDSRLGKEMLAGGARYGAAETPDDDQTADFYEIAVERLAAHGHSRATRSPISRGPGCESRHNLKYWKLEPYVGFGADAHSFDGAHARCRIPKRVEEYLARPQPGAAPEPGDLRARALLRGAAADGGHPARRPRMAALRASPSGRFWMPGCSKPTDGVLRLTSRGVMLSNEVFQEFLDL